MMHINDLHKDYYMFGGKGDVWSNTAHIAKTGESVTLCDKPMLSTNHCRIEQVQTIGCTKCIETYNNLFKVPIEAELSNLKAIITHLGKVNESQRLQLRKLRPLFNHLRYKLNKVRYDKLTYLDKDANSFNKLLVLTLNPETKYLVEYYLTKGYIISNVPRHYSVDERGGETSYYTEYHLCVFKTVKEYKDAFKNSKLDKGFCYDNTIFNMYYKEHNLDRNLENVSVMNHAFKCVDKPTY